MLGNSVLKGWFAPAGLTLDFLIRSHLLVAFYLAASAAYLSLVFHDTVDWWAIAAMFVLVWQVYSLDRYIAHPEDEALSGEPLDRVRFVRRHRTVFHVLFGISFAFEAYLMAERPDLFRGFAVGGVLGTLYVVEIPLLGKRLKCIPYLKSFYVPLVISSTMLAFLDSVPRGRFEITAFTVVYLLQFFNVVIFDLKDRENDLRAGITTIANQFGARLIVYVVQSLCVFSAATVALLLPLRQGSPMVLSLICFAGFLALPAVGRGLSSHVFFGLIDTAAALPLLFSLLIG